MKKIEPVILRETAYVAAWTVVLSLLMQAVFLILGKWDLSVLWGNFLGGGAAVLNFFLMGLGVQSSVEKEDPKDAKSVIRLSHSLRLLLLAVFAIVGVTVSVFHTVAALLPLLFPQVGVLFRPRFGGMNDKEGGV